MLKWLQKWSAKTRAFASCEELISKYGHASKHVCKVLNIFLLSNTFLRLGLNENLMLLNFIFDFFHLVPCIREF